MGGVGCRSRVIINKERREGGREGGIITFQIMGVIYETLNVGPDDIHLNCSDDQLLNALDEIKEKIMSRIVGKFQKCKRCK
jgi:hypothetical protein